MHKLTCSSLALSRDGQYLLTAGDKVIKVWDYWMRLNINFQVLPTQGGKGVVFIAESLEKRAANGLCVTWPSVPSPSLPSRETQPCSHIVTTPGSGHRLGLPEHPSETLCKGQREVIALC